MGELLKENFSLHMFLTAFMGLWAFLVISGVVKKTKNIESIKRKNILRIGISGAVICFWVYLFVYQRLYPLSIAYYEYKNNLYEETIGVINIIEREDRDRVCLTVNNKEYTLIYSADRPFINVGEDIEEGDIVKIEFGKKSKFIFDIYKSNTSSLPKSE